MAPRYGDRHDVRYADQERSTSNDQLSTLNRVTERAHGGRNMGTDTEFGGPGFWPAGPEQGPGRAVEAGCGTQIWGQTRCPIYRSGTFDVKRSTLNFQWGDRKDAWWPGYGDRHVIWTTGLLPRRTCRSAGRTVEAGCGTQMWGRHDVRYTDQERSTSNAQLLTFDGMTEKARGGQDMGTDT